MGLFDFFKKKPSKAQTQEKLKEIGVVTHYFPHVKAAVVKLSKGSVKVGSTIYIKGHTTDFRQQIKSMQYNHSPIEEGRTGQEIGLKVKARVRIGDVVYKV